MKRLSITIDGTIEDGTEHGPFVMFEDAQAAVAEMKERCAKAVEAASLALPGSPTYDEALAHAVQAIRSLT